MTFAFEYPEAFGILIPLLICLHRCQKKMAPRFFVHLHLFDVKKPWIRLNLWIQILTVTLLVVALASPVLYDRTHPDNRMGKDIVLCLDASGSMGASGFQEGSLTSRFDIVKKLSADFVKNRPNDNVGIVVYGDFAFIASPITYEKAIIVEMIDYLTQGMAGQNTAIGEALAMAVRAFRFAKAKNKVVILLTDGEHNSGKIAPKDAVALAVSQGIRIHTIGIGEEEEYDAALLQKIAHESGGISLGSSNQDELESVYEAIDELERTPIRSRDYHIKNPQYHYALAAVLALMLYLLFRRRTL